MKRISVYLKLRVLGAIDSMPGATIVSRIKEVSALSFLDEDGLPRTFTWRTIQTWLSIYKQHGVEALKTRPRTDRGRPRKLCPEDLRAALETVLAEFTGKRTNKMMLYRRAIQRGLISTRECSQSSFFRLVRQYDLLTPLAKTDNRRRLAFAKQYSNQMWQMDTMFGPPIKNGRTATQAKLIAFIDDASRVVPHGQFFFKENIDSMVTALRSALYKRGVPQTLYVDNGSIYTSAEINQICARLNILLCHTPVADGAAKGKIERFFRTVRDCFLIQKLDLSDLDALNRQFIAWLESDYNARDHSALGMKPIDRFGLDRSRIRFLDPAESSEELFYFEQTRAVRKDNTFHVDARRYEAPRLLAGRTIHVRYNRYMSVPDRIVVFYQGERMGEATLLDPIANDRRPSADPNN